MEVLVVGGRRGSGLEEISANDTLPVGRHESELWTVMCGKVIGIGIEAKWGISCKMLKINAHLLLILLHVQITPCRLSRLAVPTRNR